MSLLPAHAGMVIGCHRPARIKLFAVTADNYRRCE
jgi:hypothetical protein